MAINRADRYPGRWETESSEYPLGGPKNRTSDTAKDGSYFEKDWISDYEAFFGAILTEADELPNGTVDTATSSQLFDALRKSREVTPLNNSWNGFYTIDHLTPLPSPAGLPDTSGAGGTTYAADDEFSLDNFSSAASNTISLDDDGLIFSQGIYKLFTFTSAQLALIDVADVPVYIVGDDGSRHFVKHNGTGVVVTKPDTTTLKVQLNAAVFAELGITKVFSFFVTDGVGFVPVLGADENERNIRGGYNLLTDAATNSITKVYHDGRCIITMPVTAFASTVVANPLPVTIQPFSLTSGDYASAMHVGTDSSVNVILDSLTLGEQNDIYFKNNFGSDVSATAIIMARLA